MLNRTARSLFHYFDKFYEICINQHSGKFYSTDSLLGLTFLFRFCASALNIRVIKMIAIDLITAHVRSKGGIFICLIRAHGCTPYVSSELIRPIPVFWYSVAPDLVASHFCHEICGPVHISNSVYLVICRFHVSCFLKDEKSHI